MSNPITPPTDFRALCAELHAAFNTYAVDEAHHDLLVRAAAALRAAADQAVYNRVCHMELRLLADELEGK